MVPAADRFAALVRGRPWRRRRRAVIIWSLVLALILAGAAAAVIWLPALQVKDVEVTGTTYVSRASVEGVVDARRGHSVALTPTGRLEEQISQIDGVATAEVRRAWPDTLEVTVTERTPVAIVTGPGSTRTVIDGSGASLPPKAASGHELMALRVEDAATDRDAVIGSMLAVMSALPSDLRTRVTGASASTPSDVTIAIKTAEGASKTVVWGDAQDSELKAKAVAALLSQPGGTIDVTAPLAPVTR